MSTYMNPQHQIENILAQARAQRAQALNDAVAGGVRFIARQIVGGVKRLKAMQQERAAVAQLMAMDDRMLQDIGLNRSLVPFAVAGSVVNKAAGLYAGEAAAESANDNAFRHAA